MLVIFAVPAINKPLWLFPVKMLLRDSDVVDVIPVPALSSSIDGHSDRSSEPRRIFLDDYIVNLPLEVRCGAALIVNVDSVARPAALRDVPQELQVLSMGNIVTVPLGSRCGSIQIAHVPGKKVIVPMGANCVVANLAAEGAIDDLVPLVGHVAAVDAFPF
jgi:hypothetical protein